MVEGVGDLGLVRAGWGCQDGVVVYLGTMPGRFAAAYGDFSMAGNGFNHCHG